MENGYREIAKMMVERDNLPAERMRIGKVEELPDLKIRVGDKVTLTQSDVTALFDIYAYTVHDGERVYTFNGRRVGLICSGGEWFALGAI